MMGMDGDAERIWRPEELAAIFRHQLAAPVKFDMSNLDVGMAKRLETVSVAQGLLVKSFGDLLQHPHPPVELLNLTKEFAKAVSTHPDSPVPADVARVLYFASIAAAMTRCGKRITRLDDASLRDGIRWAAELGWLDDDTLSLLNEGLRLLEHGEAVTND